MAGVNLAVIYNFIDKERASPNAELSPATKSTPGGYTPFHLSAMFGQFETFQVLLSSHSGVDLPAWDGSTMLHIAVDHNQTTFVKLLHSLVTIFQGNDLKPQFSVDQIPDLTGRVVIVTGIFPMFSVDWPSLSSIILPRR